MDKKLLMWTQVPGVQGRVTNGLSSCLYSEWQTVFLSPEERTYGHQTENRDMRKVFEYSYGVRITA